MADALEHGALAAASEMEAASFTIEKKRARDATLDDLLQASGYLFCAPENLASTSGEMLEFFHSTYYHAFSTDALGEVVAMDTLKTKKKIWNLLELNHIELPPPTRGARELQTAALLGIVTTPPHAHSSRRVERVVPRVPRDQPDAADADGPHDDERAD